MVNCNKCQADNRDERKFCGGCEAGDYLKQDREALAALG